MQATGEPPVRTKWVLLPVYPDEGATEPFMYIPHQVPEEDDLSGLRALEPSLTSRGGQGSRSSATRDP